MGKKNNRSFYEIPYRKFIEKLKDKFNKEEEVVVEREESYTSKCDALNFEQIGKHTTYSGERIKRGLFKSRYGELLNADINGAINIMRKYALDKGIPMDTIEGDIFNPVKIDVLKDELTKSEKRECVSIIEDTVYLTKYKPEIPEISENPTHDVVKTSVRSG